MLCADHGPCVSGAHNAIVTSRAGKDLVSCLVSGLLTIGPRFGGAIDDAARCAWQETAATMANGHTCFACALMWQRSLSDWWCRDWVMPMCVAVACAILGVYCLSHACQWRHHVLAGACDAAGASRVQ